MYRPAIRFKAGGDVKRAILDGSLALTCRMRSMVIVQAHNEIPMAIPFTIPL